MINQKYVRHSQDSTAAIETPPDAWQNVVETETFFLFARVTSPFRSAKMWIFKIQL